MRPPDPAVSSLRTPAGARAVLIGLTVLGLFIFALSPIPKRLFGISHTDAWFIDSYAVLAASDAARLGLDPSLPNPLDPMRRPHSYTDWWYGLGQLGLTRDDNFLVGGLWVMAFLLVAWSTLRPRDLREATWFALALLAPPVLLALNRANNDLAIFALLGVGIGTLRPARRWGWLLLLFALALATGLKFYPVVGAAVFFLLRPARRLVVACVTAAVALAWVLSDVWPALDRGLFELPRTIHVFGALVLVRDLGGGARWLALGAVAIAAGAFWLARTGRTAGLVSESDAPPAADRRAVLFVLGAIVLLACFFAGVSYGYRWVFALWLLPWLLTAARDEHSSDRPRRHARFAGWLLLAVLWMDGLYCAFANLALGPMRLEQLQRWQLGWRLVSQPFVWVLMTLLAGWLLAAALATGRDLFRLLRSAPP